MYKLVWNIASHRIRSCHHTTFARVRHYSEHAHSMCLTIVVYINPKGSCPDSNVGWPNVGPTLVLSSRRWPNVSPTYISVWVCIQWNLKNDGQRHQMETFSALLDLCKGNPPVTKFLPQRPVTSFDVFFHLRLNKQSMRLYNEACMVWYRWNRWYNLNIGFKNRRNTKQDIFRKSFTTSAKGMKYFSLCIFSSLFPNQDKTRHDNRWLKWTCGS